MSRHHPPERPPLAPGTPRSSRLRSRARTIVGMAVAALCAMFPTAPVHAAKAMIAVAANFLEPARVLAASFESGAGHRVEIGFG